MLFLAFSTLFFLGTLSRFLGGGKIICLLPSSMAGGGAAAPPVLSLPPPLITAKILIANAKP